MTVDRYTKAVLTVIAGCLVWICAMGTGPRLEAQQTTMAIAGPVQPVVIVGTGSMDRAGKIDVSFTQQGGARTEPTVPVWMPYTPAKPLPVSLSYTRESPLPTQMMRMGEPPLPVELSSVKKPADWEPIRVRVEPGTPTAKPGGGGER